MKIQHPDYKIKNHYLLKHSRLSSGITNDSLEESAPKAYTILAISSSFYSRLRT